MTNEIIGILAIFLTTCLLIFCRRLVLGSGGYRTIARMRRVKGKAHASSERANPPRSHSINSAEEANHFNDAQEDPNRSSDPGPRARLTTRPAFTKNALVDLSHETASPVAARLNAFALVVRSRGDRRPRRSPRSRGTRKRDGRLYRRPNPINAKRGGSISAIGSALG